MRISDWSSDVCSSDLFRGIAQPGSALVWGTSGRRFESGYPDHRIKRRHGRIRAAVFVQGPARCTWPGAAIASGTFKTSLTPGEHHRSRSFLQFALSYLVSRHAFELDRKSTRLNSSH